LCDDLQITVLVMAPNNLNHCKDVNMSDFVNAFQALELKWKCPGRRHPDSDKKSEEQKEEVLATPTKVDEARYSVIHVYFIVGKFESYMHVTNILRKKMLDFRKKFSEITPIFIDFVS